MKRNLIILSIGLLTTLFANSQHSPEYEAYKLKYPNAHSVQLLQEITLHITLEDDAIVIKQKVHEEDLYLDAAATYRSKKAINYSSFYELESVEASSLLYENGKYNELKVKDFLEKDEMGTSFYDDSKSVNFIYPNLESGAKSSLEYTKQIKNPRFLNAFFFGDFEPITKNKFTIIADQGISFNFKEFNCDKIKVTFSEKEKRGKRIYTWETTDIAAYDYESQSPNYRTKLPHIIPIITKYKLDGKEIKLSEGVSDLYSWYYSLIKNVNKDAIDTELEQQVHSLIKDKETDLEKVKAIYYWVQENIKYIAFEYELGGFLPREANDVYQKKYGDCKDNSSILYRMLKVAGLQGNITWIGTRSIPYKYNEVPTPIVDNHMILVYSENDVNYFLDATGRYIPIDFPTSFIQGKEALIATDEESYRIEKVPIVSSDRNIYTDSTYIKINDKSLVGTGQFRCSGYPKIDLFNDIESIKKDEELKEFYAYHLRKGNNKFLITDFSEKNKFHYDEDFEVFYNFSIDDYTSTLDDELYVNLNLNREISYLKTDKDRKNSREFKYKLESQEIVVLEIPEDKEVSYIPQNFDISNELFSCSITYTQKDRTIEYQLVARTDFLILTLEQQKLLNEIIKKVEKQFKEVIILKNKN